MSSSEAVTAQSPADRPSAQPSADRSTDRQPIKSDDRSEGRVTLADVARAAGVSLATASKAMHNVTRVSAATRARVQQTAKDMGYRPNATAQSLATGRSNAIGLITSDFQGVFSTPILLGVEDELGVRSNSVMLCNARGDAMLEKTYAQFLLSRNVDGLIIVGQDTNPRPPLDVDTAAPIVYAYAPSSDPADCSITCDNVGAGRMAVEHLISCGKRRIAIIAGEGSYKAAHDRVQGARTALQQAGLQPVGPVRAGGWSADWGRAATRLLLDQHVEFDGVVCQSDAIAWGCMDALKERGLSIPGDVAVIGHDDWAHIVQGLSPKLTSISNRTNEIGRMAARTIIDAVAGNAHHGVTYLPCSISQRESTLPLND
ncbi:LacI family transcriptional regulator [Bifidobacterium amazonense]|uniref:LacI family transcriptional regulator n=1 Tax=Bifidobacterium amazonense TaxID=2809027 RepID=A0ABS9VXB7_9BIFI|nr:LacI family DNA-binding transcriptional regulator [Bifidobacterium amazonense]MCH9276551.1 LacI family transcriptional regulator [Bifidobacterium amazonense]